MNGSEEFYKTMRIDIPPSLLHGVDSARLKGRKKPGFSSQSTLRIVRRDSSAPKTHYSQLLKSLYAIRTGREWAHREHLEIG